MPDILGLAEDIEEEKKTDTLGLIEDIPTEAPVKTWAEIKPIISAHTTPQEQTKVKNAMAISATHDIDFDVAYDTEPNFIKRENKPNLAEYAGRSFVAGVGDLYIQLANTFKWLQIPMGKIGDDWERYGKQMQNMYIPSSDKPFTYDRLLDPAFYATNVTRTVPSTLSLIPAALIGSELGIGAGTAIVGRELGMFAKTVLGSIGAATLSRPLESAMEASQTYQQAIDSGKTEDEAGQAANDAFKGNMALAGLDAAEFFTAFMPMKFNSNILALRVLASMGKLAGVGAMEGAEERYQQVIQEMAVNKDVSMKDFFNLKDPNINEATVIGAIFGVGMGGVGSVYNSFTNRIVNEFSPEIRAVYNASIEDSTILGLTSEEAVKKALDEIAATPEGEKEIKDSVEKIKEQAQNITNKAEVDLITEGIKPPLEITPKAEDITEGDITEFVESEIAEPMQLEQLQKAPVEPTIPLPSAEKTSGVYQLDENKRMAIKQIQQDLEVGQAPQLLKKETEKGIKYTRTKSSNPEYFTTLAEHYTGVTKSYVNNILDKALYGKPLTEKQTNILNDIVNAKTQEIEGQKYYIREQLPKIPVGDLNLNVGDEFKINGEKFKVTEKDAEGNLKIKDSIEYNVDVFDKIPKPDEGSIKKGGETKPPSIPEASFKVTTPETQGVKTVKQRIRQTTGQATLSDMVREDDALYHAIKKSAQAAKEAYKVGNLEGVETEKVKMHNMLDRAKKIKAVQEFFNLTYADMKKVSRKNPLLMSQYEFKLYLDDVRQKSLELTTNKMAKINLTELIRRKELQKVENLQRAMKFPPISKMTTEQANAFFDILDKYQKGDVFLSETRLEMVDRTDLKGIKTWREAKERIAKEAGIPFEELTNLKITAWDKLRYDSALMRRHPFLQILVTDTTESEIISEMRFREIEKEAFRLAKESEASRKMTPQEKNINAFVPQDKDIIGYIEAPEDQKGLYIQKLTPEQIDYANYIINYKADALKYLIETQALLKGRENYFVHVRQDLLESIKEHGLSEAVKGLFKQYEQDMNVFNIMDDSTGDYLPLEKFFPFTLPRTGALEPSSNVTKAFLTYARLFERKVALDQIITKLDIYAQALTPQKLTPRGLEMDRSLKKFVNEYINNKKGRRLNFSGIVKQGGAIDMGLRAIRSFTSLLDLGFNIPVGVTTLIGEQVSNFVQMGMDNMAKGAQRAFTEHGKAIINKYDAWIGRSAWENFTAPGKGLAGKFHEGLFAGFQEASRIANTNYLLGMITADEFNSETISTKRLAELRLEMGRMRVVPGSKSLVGSTSLGQVLMQYKTWAVPSATTAITDISTFVADLKNKPFNEALTTKEAREFYRIAGLTSTIIIAGAVLSGEDEKKDNTLVGQLLRKAYRESLQLIGAVDPTLYTPIRAISFLTDLAKNLKAIVLLEEYETKPGLKGVEGLEKQLLPKAIRQFQIEKKEFKR